MKSSFFDSCRATWGTHNSFICLTEGLQLPTTRVFLCASLFSSGAGKAVLEFHHNTAKWENPSLHKSNKFTTISSVLKIQLTCPGMRSPVLHSCGSHLSRLCSGTFALACKLLWAGQTTANWNALQWSSKMIWGVTIFDYVALSNLFCIRDGLKNGNL